MEFIFNYPIYYIILYTDRRCNTHADCNDASDEANCHFVVQDINYDKQVLTRKASLYLVLCK